ncbi:adenine phosphoribosyltransferase [Lactobacillus helveticus]|uniref:Purine/Pyrimidine phosphoribosyltransferase n=2 Tax=Lactobacillus helveticus TaxID=1587 RepID=A8YXQ6_LACH4|nr:MULTISPECIES: phosphoribosyltransferase family protein [Lactobacillus]ABX27756.1 Purine/Pyrimidine phosphoribosyltransferase [Lactobacillus helveticus DPC 4571]AHI12594.1 Purine/Pyrimidine phosphoribosyltransferase [Lactobacillus helveticus H9]AKG67472.1 adenine phosphoribosyltransferase [Lactobacillus helveticus]ANZ56380.1 adenine phosphoribosyltransferase [Lactobacillus helveticus]AQR54836.1 adenine phosphoribosyltransferase [Lactobacillus delbrueckii subsp. bulgaricus]
MEQTYELKVGQLKRTLPIIPINDTTAIASFVLLGDSELAHEAAQQLSTKITENFDYIVTLECKGIPLAEEMSRLTNHPKFVVLRKSVKAYMTDPLEVSVKSITTTDEQKLVLDGHDAEQLAGKHVILVDDVISTGGSLEAAERLLTKAHAKTVAKCAILAEGDAANRTDIIYLEKLPLFSIKSVK